MLYPEIIHCKSAYSFISILCSYKFYFQPGSTVSASTHSSSRARTRQYRTVAHTAQVDECLFGAPNHDTQRRQLLEEKWREQDSPIVEEARERSAGRKKNKKAKETVQVITKDLIRNLMYVQSVFI